MEWLHDATNSTGDSTAAGCARVLLDGFPPVARYLRKHIRPHRDKGLSLPQFRTLALLRSAPAANLTAVAEFLGASLPTTSRVVAGLAEKGLVRRRGCDRDRRRLELELTPRGVAVMDKARREAESKLTAAFDGLEPAERDAVLQGMTILHRMFAPELRSGEVCAPAGQLPARSGKRRRREFAGHDT